MNVSLKRKASQALGGARMKRSVVQQSVSVAPRTLKRKSSTELQGPSGKRRALDIADDTADKKPTDTSTQQNPQFLEFLPIDILDEIISWSSTPDPDAVGSGLYLLTRVSKTMAELALPAFIKSNKDILPKVNTYHIHLNNEAFSLFPAWARSDSFASRSEIVCHFTAPNIERKIRALDVGLESFAPTALPKTFTLEGDLNLAQGLSLLDIAGRSGAESVELEVFHLDWSSHQPAPDRVIHELTHIAELKIEWPSLPSHHWRALLRAISAPKLRVLTLYGGGVPWTALASFLARHPTITQFHLPACQITRVPLRHCALGMPGLVSLKGKLSQVVSLLKLLSRPKNLSIEGGISSNTPLVQVVHKIVAALALCNSNVSLVANLTSTKESGHLTKARPFPVKTLENWRKSPSRLSFLKHLRLIVSGIQDSVLLGHCANILAVFTGLKLVTLRRNGGQYGWEWAQVTRDSGTDVVWDCMEPSSD